MMHSLFQHALALEVCSEINYLPKGQSRQYEACYQNTQKANHTRENSEELDAFIRTFICIPHCLLSNLEIFHILDNLGNHILNPT